MAGESPSPIRLLGLLSGGPGVVRTQHFIGMPPENGAKCDRRLLPRADFVILEQTPEGYFLYRYTGEGKFGGDTWHQSVEEAKAQTGFEFPLTVTQWSEISADVADLIEFGIREWNAFQSDGETQ